MVAEADVVQLRKSAAVAVCDCTKMLLFAYLKERRIATFNGEEGYYVNEHLLERQIFIIIVISIESKNSSQNVPCTHFKMMMMEKESPEMNENSLLYFSLFSLLQNSSAPTTATSTIEKRDYCVM
jgi:hypothetical protein